MYADIIVDISHEHLDKTFQYAVPDYLLDEIDIGMMVNVPFGRGNKIITGYVVNLTKQPSYDILKIKNIKEVVPQRVKTVERMIQLAAWLRRNYGSTMNQALKTVIPVKDKIQAKQKKMISLAVSKEEACTVLEQLQKKHAVAMARVIQALITEGKSDVSDIQTKLNITAKTIQALEDKGLIQVETAHIYRNPIKQTVLQEEMVELNNQQKEAIHTFIEDYDNAIRKTYLLYGITGSGKTNVYIEMIEHVVALGKQVIVLIPEIALTFQTVQRFYRRFGDKVSIMNSRMSKGERYDQFKRAMTGEIRIMIGPRSVLFTPFNDLGLIVIDEEHETAYKSEQSPKYHARETAVHIAQTMSASVVLGSATPSLESFYRAKQGIYQLMKLDKRATGAKLPNIYVEDLRKELNEGNRSILSRRLASMIDDRLKKHQQVILFLNKRGYAGFISCRSCGKVFKCPHCDISLTHHINPYGNELVCHYCGYRQPEIKECPECGSKYVSGFRAGTQQVEQMLSKTFPTAKILRMDMDTTSKKGSHEAILSSFANHEADILVGTQMIVKGHDFPHVTLVGILAADMSLYVSDYRASERTFQLLVQAAGRAGRAKMPGDVVIQTYTPNHYSIVAAKEQNYEQFYNEEIIFRQMLGYPPIQNILKISISCKKEEELLMACQDIAKWQDKIKDEFLIKNDMCSSGIKSNLKMKINEKGELQITGPIKAPIYKLNDIYTQIILVKSKDYERLADFKDKCDIYVRDNILYKNISVQYDFN